MGADLDVEKQRLLPQQAQPPAAAPQRSWRGHLLNPVGEGSPEDVAACCLSLHAPFVAFGWVPDAHKPEACPAYGGAWPSPLLAARHAKQRLGLQTV